MSKKDYQAIAKAIYLARAQANYAFDRGGNERALETRFAGIAALEYVQDRIAHVMTLDSPRFDRARFIEACETGTCKGMSK